MPLNYEHQHQHQRQQQHQHTSSPHLCRLCISLIGPTYADLQKQIMQAVPLADLIEIRLDKLEFINLNHLQHLQHLQQLQQLQQSCPLPILFTLRKASQGGSFKGSETERIQLLHSLLDLKPDYVDLEADTPLADIQALQRRSPETKWVLSWHDFNSTPADLDAIFQKMAQIPADFYKIVTKANGICDSLRMIHLAKKVNAERNILCALCMGEEGQCTRILSPTMGNPFTFAALDTGLESAPGQLSAQTLLENYHFRKLDRDTLILGLIGDPVDKSLSHLTHNAVLRGLNLNGVYVKFKVKPEELSEFMQHAFLLGIKGLSVTMPHKEKILSCIRLSHSAPVLERIGACNTLAWTDKGFIGCNTDGKGILKALGIDDFLGKKMVILGAGGTAKAVAYEAKKLGALLTILNRTPAKAQQLAAHLDCQWGELKEHSRWAQQGYDILVQTTSVGMAPHIEESLLSNEDLIPGSRVIDAISNPKETRLLREARLKGCQTYPGLEMFIHQAVAQFVFWFGPDLDQSFIEKTIRQHLPSSISQKSLHVQRSQLEGKIALPPSKSHSIRAILLAAMAEGQSLVYHPLRSPDIIQAIRAMQQLGAIIHDHGQYLEIHGVKGKPKAPDDVIDAGNSGQVLRFVGALAALGDHYTVISGDHSIRSNRPIQPLLEGLRLLGGWAESTRQNGYAPIIIKGPLKAGQTVLSGEDSQPVSALLMAAAFVEGLTEVRVYNPGEKPWITLTLSWLDRLGVPYTNDQFERLTVRGKERHTGFTVTIPGDFSSAAFPIAAALLTQSELTIENVDMDDVQGDKAIIPLLQEMGAIIEIDPARRLLMVKKGGALKGQTIDLDQMIDAITILAVVGCFAKGETRLINGAIARHKECDRITCITSELTKMGADIRTTEDGLIIRRSHLKGTHVKSYNDHRMALSLVVAGLVAEGETHIEGIECMNKSYPTFISDMQNLGAWIQVTDH